MQQDLLRRVATPLAALPLAFALGCGSGGDGEDRSKIHALTAWPGCFTPGAPVVLDAGSAAETQRVAAERQAREFRMVLATQLYGLLVDAMRAEPEADRWGFDLEASADSTSRGLSGGGSSSAPGTYGSGGQLAIPGRAREREGVVRAEARLSERGAETGRFVVELTERRCAGGTCAASIREAVGRWSPEVSELDLGATTLLWNHDFLYLGPRLGSGAAHLRGCNPDTGVRFESRAGRAPEAPMTVDCWDALGQPLSCVGVDLTPGL